MGPPLESEKRLALMQLAAGLVLDELRTEDAVALASTLVASGAQSGAALELAVMPADPKRLRRSDVEPLVRTMLTELGVVVPPDSEAGWMTARFIAEAMIAGAIDPPTGAYRLWDLWDVCGEPNDELTWMLQLHDAWEVAVGPRRVAIEAEMLEYAPRVIAAADRKTAG